MQLLEIYNEQLRDLLDEQRSGRRLDIRSTERSGLNVPDAIQARSASPSAHRTQEPCTRRCGCTNAQCWAAV